MKIILFLLLLLLLNILTDVAQGIVILPTKIRLSNSTLYWALNGSDVILSSNGTDWAIYNNVISPYGDETAVQYRGPGNQLAIANKGGPGEKWDVGSIMEPQFFYNITICSRLVPSECATASEIKEGGEVIAYYRQTGDLKQQLWTLE